MGVEYCITVRTSTKEHGNHGKAYHHDSCFQNNHQKGVNPMYLMHVDGIFTKVSHKRHKPFSVMW